MRKVFTAILVAGAATAIACGAGEVADNNSLPAAPDTSTTAAATTPAAKLKPGIYEEGVLLVPSEVKPGRYRAVVPSDSYGCYWARLKNTAGELEGVITNGNATPKQKVSVTVKSTDKAFETNGCGNWVKY